MPAELTRDDVEIVNLFRSLRTGRDVANILEVSYSDLTYYLYRKPMQSNYREFSITKRSGGLRTICAPISPIKILQKKLNYILQLIYTPKRCVHGFINNRSVLTNAQSHVRKTVLLNIDLSDFFPSINFGRVRGMFMARPYNVKVGAATVLAQICCYDGCLPQGAPTSPVVSNMICGKLDSDLLRLSRRFRCTYTRYADDITFSTTQRRMPSSLGVIDFNEEDVCVSIGDLLRTSIESNGFNINASKIRMQRNGSKKEVTGIIVNESPNVNRKFVRQLRAIINAIQKFGLENAEQEFYSRYYRKNRKPGTRLPPLVSVIEGKFNYFKMIKGEFDPVYRRLYNRYLESIGRPRRYFNDPLSDLPPALWILESEDPISQGTAFYLQDYGLITCQHVLRPRTHAFQYNSFGNRVHIGIIRESADLDAAILQLPSGDYPALEIGDPASVNQGDRLTLAGFPNYRFGDTPYITEGRVAGFRTITAQRWILLSTPIIAGNSGGPVLDSNGRVVGIAATGADNMESLST